MRQPSLCNFLMQQLPRKIREGSRINGEWLRGDLTDIALEFSEPPFREFLDAYTRCPTCLTRSYLELFNTFP